MKMSKPPRGLREIALYAVFLVLLAAPAGASAANLEPLWQAPADGARGSGAGQMNQPGTIAADPHSGHVFVADFGNARVVEFTAFGVFVKAWGWGVANGSAELQQCGPGATPPTETCRAGTPGIGAGQFGVNPTGFPNGGIAVDSEGNIYVGDMENFRVEKFDSTGSFVFMLGGGVNKTDGTNICTSADIQGGDECGGGAPGAGNGEFKTTVGAGTSANFLAVDASDSLYVGDKERVQVFASTGSFSSDISLPAPRQDKFTYSLALDSVGNVLFTTSRGGGFGPEPDVLKMSSSGVLLQTITTAGGYPEAVTVDAADNLFIALEGPPLSHEHREVVEYASDGTPLISPGSGFLEGNGQFAEGGSFYRGLASNVVRANGESDLYLSSLSQSQAFLTAYGPAPDKWPPPLRPPTILSQFSESVGTDGATVRATINPHFWADTTFYVEYGTGTCSLGGCPQTQPAAPGTPLGTGQVDQSATTKPIVLSGLAPGTTYHYRFVAQSTGGGPTVGVGAAGEEETFITPQIPSGEKTNCPNQSLRFGAAAKLPDCRAYEMVTPVEKNNTDITPLINISSLPATLDQSAVSGDKLTYTAQGFGDSVGTPYLSQYVASRGAEGWSSHAITPSQGVSPAEPGNRIDIEFRAFTPDLCAGVLLHTTDPPLAPGAEEHQFNLYRRQNCGEEGYETLLPGRPGPVTYGVSADGRCTVYGGSVALSENGKGTVFETCEGGPQQKVSVLPNGNAIEGTVGTSGAGISPRNGTRLRAVSEDGSRVYWTRTNGTLYLRINAGEPQSKIEGGECVEPEMACTLPVSQTVSGEDAHFLTASPDGTKAVFALGSPELYESELYEYDLESEASTLIASEAFQEPNAVPVLGSSGDPDHIFFVSPALLTGANQEGREPTAGKANVYLYNAEREGADRYRFIGTLTESDVHPGLVEGVLQPSPVASESFLSLSRVSPDGLHLAFMSSAPLTGYNNTDARSGKKDLEVFSYDATAENGAGRLLCVSCNPARQRPEGRDIEIEIGLHSGSWGAALLPFPATELYGSRVISEDGSRIYFDSFEALVPRDTNGKADVYEWEAVGAGDCDETGASFSAENGGCLNLISTGESATDSRFVDASPDGRDVFFRTASSLAPQDVGLIDIYDAREGGGYPAPPSPRPACEGEACQGPLSPPNDPTPASSTFEGAGNVKPTPTASRCGKGKTRRKGRCVAKKHSNRKSSKHKGNGAKKRSNHNRRNAR